MVLKINSKNYTVKFDFQFQKLLCNHYGFKRLSELNKVLKKLDWSRGYTEEELSSGKIDLSELEPTIEEIEVLGDVAYYGLKSANSKLSISKNDVITVLAKDEHQVVALLTFLRDSLVKENQPVDPEKRGN